MYDDYKVVYKSNLNEFFIIWLILGVIGIFLLIFTIFSLSKVYKKANRSGIAPWIPIYNVYLLVEIANLPILYFFLLLIPIANIYAMYKISISIATLFKKNKLFGLGLFFLPFIFYPILAFSDSEYIGINLFALQGSTTVEDIPIIDENKQKEITVEENSNIDVASRNINISIGGGRYQKDYVNNLADVDREKVLNKVVAEKEAKKNPSERIFINNELVNELKVEQPENTNNDLFSVPFINTEPTEEKIEESENNVNTINGVAISSRSESITSEKVAPNANGEYNTCPNCGTRVGENAKICFVCGHPLQ